MPSGMRVTPKLREGPKHSESLMVMRRGCMRCLVGATGRKIFALVLSWLCAGALGPAQGGTGGFWRVLLHRTLFWVFFWGLSRQLGSQTPRPQALDETPQASSTLARCRKQTPHRPLGGKREQSPGRPKTGEVHLV